MRNDFNSDSRSGNRAKRKKTNIVLNSLIVLIMALIVFVAYTIFASGDNDKATPKKESPKTEEKQTVDKEGKDKEKTEDVTVDDDPSADDANEEDKESVEAEESEDASTPESADDSQAVITEGDSTSNIIKSTENPAWKPVGTTQTGEHTPVYSGVDWDEMLNAITYATGLGQSDMTVYWLGRDKSATNGSIGTVTSKDKQQKYNVYLQWVDGEGWKPTKVEELAEIQR